MRSSGEIFLFKNNNVKINTRLSTNSRFFLSPLDQIEALTKLPEQNWPTHGNSCSLLIDLFESRDLAYVITIFDWHLFNNVHPYELIYNVFGSNKFNKITVNLDLLMRRFNEIQYWVCTELCLCQNIGKRVTLLRKFIKLASYCKGIICLFNLIISTEPLDRL